MPVLSQAYFFEFSNVWFASLEPSKTITFYFKNYAEHYLSVVTLPLLNLPPR